LAGFAGQGILKMDPSFWRDEARPAYIFLKKGCKILLSKKEHSLFSFVHLNAN
jgi:hypothetical protein